MNHNFDKSFESLYTTAMVMADNCIVNKASHQRIAKLEEEYKELLEALLKMAEHVKELQDSNDPAKFATTTFHDLRDAVRGELGDVLFVLLHIAHKNGFTAFELLHAASSKMLARMNDPEYKAKN